jgi:hypothetical protein
MLSRRRFVMHFLLLGLALLPLGCRSAAPPRSDDEPAEPPRLVVLLVFDQLRGDFLSRWQDLFEEGGFAG